MTRTIEMPAIGDFSLPSRARLMLDIGAPRIAMRAAEVKGAFRELQHASAAQVARTLAGVPGLEALAVLGSLPTDNREGVIRQLQLDDHQETELLDLARTIGDPNDQQSLAAKLTTMYPEIGEQGEDSFDSDETGVLDDNLCPDGTSPLAFCLGRQRGTRRISNSRGQFLPVTNKRSRWAS